VTLIYKLKTYSGPEQTHVARFRIFSHEVRLSPLGTAVTVWPIVPAPDDR
jgi:hypothetical protein